MRVPAPPGGDAARAVHHGFIGASKKEVIDAWTFARSTRRVPHDLVSPAGPVCPIHNHIEIDGTPAHTIGRLKNGQPVALDGELEAIETPGTKGTGKLAASGNIGSNDGATDTVRGHFVALFVVIQGSVSASFF